MWSAIGDICGARRFLKSKKEESERTRQTKGRGFENDKKVKRLCYKETWRY